VARKPALDSCMFCTDEGPCGLHAPKQKATKPKSRPKKTPTVDAQGKVHDCAWCTPEEFAAGMPCACNTVDPAIPLGSDPLPEPTPRRADARAAMRAHVRAPVAPPAQPAGSIDRDTVMEDAIRSLAPILHPVERRAYADLLTAPRTVETRAIAWREKQRGI
jgi:hypothetical protein